MMGDHGWRLTAIVKFSRWNSADLGAWVAGSTTWNQVGQGDTPAEALESLVICLTVAAAWEVRQGREPFVVMRLGEEPLIQFRPRGDEIVFDPDDQTATFDEGERYTCPVFVRRSDVDAVPPLPNPNHPRA